MEQFSGQNYNFSPSFYEKYTQDDENMQAKIKPILNQIHENRVIVKELHTQYSVNFSEMMNSYINRLEDLGGHYDEMIEQLKSRREKILEMTNKIIKKHSQYVSNDKKDNKD